MTDAVTGYQGLAYLKVLAIHFTASARQAAATSKGSASHTCRVFIIDKLGAF